MKKIIYAINQLKKNFSGKNLKEFSVLLEVKKSISSDSELNQTAVGRNLIADIDACIQNKEISRFKNNKNHINIGRDNMLFSLFSASYFEELSVDGFFYEEIKVPETLKQKINSPACPVKIIEASEGFLSEKVVALFPENHIDNIQIPEDRIFYFIDRFVKRFFNITKPLLNLVSTTQFSKLKHATAAEIEYASSCWVYLHEYFHRQGPMPIANYLDVKGSKATAGLEELRVDILSILACVENPHLFPNARFVGEFILMERLMRYGAESPEKLTYDAISSQFLFKYLLSHKGIMIDENFIISINQNIFLLLKQLANKINDVESEIKVLDRVDVKNKLKKLVFEYVGYDKENKKFMYEEYFKWMRPGFFLANNFN